MNPKSGRAKPARSFSVPILRSCGGQYGLETQNIEEVFCRDNIANAKVVVISMCGAMQCGKSLSLNHFYDYLTSTKTVPSPREFPPKQCFDWASNGIKTQRKTIGIHITRKPIIFRRGGENLAVFLMDSEGMSTVKTSHAQNFIFALVTLLSSVQIINVENDIHDRDMFPLKAFIAAYNELKDCNKNKALFESNLLLLVRDCASTMSSKLGEDDEKVFLSKSFRSGYKRTIHDKLFKAFARIDCFLMPHPGAAATVRQLRPFQGSYKELNESFVLYLRILMNRVLRSENLVTKLVHGKSITCQEFPDYIDACFNALDGNDLCTGLLKLISHTRYQPLVEECKRFFRNALETYAKKLAIDEEEFADVCETINDETMEMFDNDTSLGNLIHEKEKHHNMLQRELRNIMEDAKVHTEQFYSSSKQKMEKDIMICKKTYERELQSMINRGITDRQTFRNCHETAVHNTVTLFERRCMQGGEKFIESARTILHEDITEIFNSKLEDMLFDEDDLCENDMEKTVIIGVRGGKLEHESCMVEFQSGTFTGDTEVTIHVSKKDGAPLPAEYICKSPVLRFEPSDQRLRKKAKCKIFCWYITFSPYVNAEDTVIVMQQTQDGWVKIHQEIIKNKLYLNCTLTSLSPVLLAVPVHHEPRQVASILYQNPAGDFIAKFFNMSQDYESVMVNIHDGAKSGRHLIVSDVSTIEVKPSDEVELSLTWNGESDCVTRHFAAEDIYSPKSIKSEQFIRPSVEEAATEMLYEVKINGQRKIFNPFIANLNNPGRPPSAAAGIVNFIQSSAVGDYMTIAGTIGTQNEQLQHQD